MVELHRAGRSFHELSKEFGCSAWAIRYWIVGGLSTAFYGGVVGQPEITMPALAVAGTGGVGAIVADVLQGAAGIFQRAGGAGYSNLRNAALILATGYGLRAVTMGTRAGGNLTRSQRTAASSRQNGATVVGGTYDLLTTAISSLGPQQAQCSRE